MEYPAGSVPGTRSLIQRMIGAAMLDASVYEEVEADRGATGQAALVVAITAVCAAIGSWGHGHAQGVIGAVISAFIGWFIMAGLTYFVGTKFFGGTADMGEMLRTIGFSRSPGVLAIVGFIPILGWIVLLAVALWQLVTAVIAIRQALDFDTGKAVLTALIAWIICMVVVALIMGFFLGTAALAGGLSH
jgi:hypothetical protein